MMTTRLKFTNYIPTQASPTPTPTTQKFTRFHEYSVSPTIDSPISLSHRTSYPSLEESRTAPFSPPPKIYRPIAVLAMSKLPASAPQPPNVVSALSVPPTNVNSAISLNNRVSKRSRDESEIPTSTPFKRPRGDQPITETPVPTPQVPTTVSTFGDVNSDGSRYSGSRKDGLYHGLGTLTSANGDTIYTGHFRYGAYDGHGNLTVQNGAGYTIYIGEFRRGVFHGSGSLTYPNGTSYAGQFQNGVFHGEGIFISGIYGASGQFQNNLLHGKGTVLIKDIQTYFGDVKNGLYDGRGLLIDYSKGTSYDGEFQNNFYNGEGKLTFSNGMPPQIGKFRLGIYQ
jgi:hypothetical protein